MFASDLSCGVHGQDASFLVSFSIWYLHLVAKVMAVALIAFVIFQAFSNWRVSWEPKGPDPPNATPPRNSQPY